MEEYIKKALKNGKYESSIELSSKICQNITIRQKRIAYFRIISLSSISMASLIGFIPMFKILANDFTQSGFYEYLSLTFSNGGVFSKYSQDFFYSLAESLPTMSIIFSLTLVFIFFLSLRYAMKQIINNNYIRQYRVIA